MRDKIVENVEQQIENEMKEYKMMIERIENDKKSGDDYHSSFFTKENIEKVIENRKERLIELERRGKIDRRVVKIYVARTQNVQGGDVCGNGLATEIWDRFPNHIYSDNWECDIFAFHMYRHVGGNRPWLVDDDVIDDLYDAARRGKRLIALCFDWQAAPYGADSNVRYRYIKEIDGSKIWNRNFLIVDKSWG